MDLLVTVSGGALVSLPTGAAVPWLAPVLVVVLALLAAALLVWLRASRRRATATLERERARHAALQRRVAGLESLDLTARRLAATTQHAQIADHTARAATELFGACESVLRIQVAEDLTVTARRSMSDHGPALQVPDVADTAGDPDVAGTDPTDDAERAVEQLADVATSRRAPVRSEAPATGDTDEPNRTAVHRIASPLRYGDGLVGVLVLGRPPADGAFDAADSSLVERLTAHVALAVARSGAHVVASTAATAQDDPTASGSEGASAVLSTPPDPHTSSCDLVAVLREVTLHARAMAEDQGHPRRVAVLAPQRAIAQLPEPDVRELVRATYELVIGATEPGSNLAVELLAQEDAWELVVAHGGVAIPTPVLEASPAAAAVQQLGGEVESGQGAGVARLRILLRGSRAPELAGGSAVPVRLA